MSISVNKKEKSLVWMQIQNHSLWFWGFLFVFVLFCCHISWISLNHCLSLHQFLTLDIYIYITVLVSAGLGDSLGKGVCCQAWQPEYDTQGSPGGVPWPAHTHTHTPNKRNWCKRNLTYYLTVLEVKSPKLRQRQGTGKRFLLWLLWEESIFLQSSDPVYVLSWVSIFLCTLSWPHFPLLLTLALLPPAY